MDAQITDVTRGMVHALVQLNKVFPSPTNPRKAFDKRALEELAASIKTHGVLHPVVVRRWPASRKPPKDFPEASETGFELVVDVRKILAATPAGKCRKCGCTEDKPCKGGCGWTQVPDPKTGLGLCSRCAAAAAIHALHPKRRAKSKH